jgi:hypothetical protein
MAKVSAKKKTPTKSSVSVKKVVAKKKATTPLLIEKVSATVLEKLKTLQLDPQLQSDIEWCLGSFSHDKNPIGLFETGDRALEMLKTELAKKTKGVTTKLVADLEKALSKK